MPVRKILLYADAGELLRKPSVRCSSAKEVRQLCVDLKATLLAHDNAIGLAAPQIGRHKRVFVLKPQDKRKPIVCINPIITTAFDYQMDADGCLSIPDVTGQTYRPHKLTVWCLDEHGKPTAHNLEGLDAVAAHHENDHLDGVLFVDRLDESDDVHALKLKHCSVEMYEQRRRRAQIDRLVDEALNKKRF